MRIPAIFRPQKYGSTRKILLFIALGGTIVTVVFQIIDTYHSFEAEMGSGIAQTAIAYHLIFIAGMIALGLRLAYEVERMICQEKFLFGCPKRGGFVERIMRLWGHDVESSEEADVQPAPEEVPAPDPVDVPATWNVPTRRGRKPTFTLDRWMPVAMQWENRDTIRDGFTLTELICEHLGTNKDGSPIISEQTYYSTWRSRAIEEMNRRAALKQAGTRSSNQQKN